MGFKDNCGYHHDFVVFMILVTVAGMSVAFSVNPMGSSGAIKSGKSNNFGVSWSRNLEAEVKQRKELCPLIPQQNGYQYRFHNETGTCYKVGDKGPCGDNMIFFAYQTNAVYGQCDCNYNDNTRALILDKERKSCHFVYTKGYCREGEWLTFSSTWDPICEPNACLKFYDHVDIHNNVVIPSPPTKITVKAVSVEFVPYKNNKKGSYSYSCVPLGLSCEDKDMDEDSFSKWGSLSHLPHEVQFVKGKVDPTCAPSSDHIHWRYPIPKMQCLPGSFLMGGVGVQQVKCNHAMKI